MIAMTLTMILVSLIALGVVGLVLVGLEGRGGDRAPRVADTMARAARHFNGEGRPPTSVTRLLRRSRTAART